MVSVAHDTPLDATDRPPVRVLGVFAHPDDETLCAGGTLAKYASAGADVRVVSLTKGGAGQIRDAERGDPGDPDGGSRAGARGGRESSSGSPGRGAWTTPTAASLEVDGRAAASSWRRSCSARSTPTWSSPSVPTGSPDTRTTWPSGQRSPRPATRWRSTRPIRLFHCHLPRSRMLLRDRLAEWVVELTTRFKGTQDFVRALTVFSREATALGYAADFVRVDWFPSGSYLLEQGEPATTMHFLLSGQVEIRREGEDGRVAVVDRSGPGRVHRRGGHRHRPAAQRARGGGGRRHEPDVPRAARLLRRARGPGAARGSPGRCPRGTRSTRG